MENQNNSTQIQMQNVNSNLSVAIDALDISQEMENLRNTINTTVGNLSTSISAGSTLDVASQANADASLIQKQMQILNSNINTINNFKKDLTNNIMKLDEMSKGFNNKIRTLQATPAPQKMANKTYFNLKKYSQELEELSNPQDICQVPFKDQISLKQCLDSNDYVSSREKLLNYAKDQNDFDSKLKVYFETEMAETDKVTYVTNVLWDSLHESAKEPEVGKELVPVVHKEIKGKDSMESNNKELLSDIKDRVLKVSNSLKELAQKHSTSTGSFNLKKFSQHKSLENVLLYSPEEKTLDPFTNHWVSNWHIVERNKGWGFRIGDHWDVDFETIWRNHIMDKYSDDYLARRFETDKWIPETNNLQLKPGQLRKPYLPEHSSIEARMQAKRGKEDKDEKPFDWLKASTKEIEIKIANLSVDELSNHQRIISDLKYLGLKIESLFNNWKMTREDDDKNDYLNGLKAYSSYVNKLNSTIDTNNISNSLSRVAAKKEPCWKGYEMVGMKDKDGKEVPNCVPSKKKVNKKAFRLKDNETNPMFLVDKDVNDVKKDNKCPICNSSLGKMKGSDYNNYCPNHGVVNPEYTTNLIKNEPSKPKVNKNKDTYIPNNALLTAQNKKVKLTPFTSEEFKQMTSNPEVTNELEKELSDPNHELVDENTHGYGQNDLNDSWNELSGDN